jgi:hypothetical protein
MLVFVQFAVVCLSVVTVYRQLFNFLFVTIGLDVSP